jgi:hypothetical protein
MALNHIVKIQFEALRIDIRNAFVAMPITTIMHVRFWVIGLKINLRTQ